MANIFEHRNRHLVPNWRSFGRTAVLGELASYQVTTDNRDRYEIDGYIIDFKLNRSVIHASDLLSAAIANNSSTDREVIEAARFILARSSIASKSQVLLAERVMTKPQTENLLAEYQEAYLRKLEHLYDRTPFYQRIHAVKNRIKKYPRNAVLYVELARYYSILGEESRALDAMRLALHLAPNNRYVLRCATRLYAHCNSEDNNLIGIIHDKLCHNQYVKYDPWLLSAEIAIATMRKRHSKLIKHGKLLIKTGQVKPGGFTELASSIGTTEMLYGSTRKSSEFFQLALLEPNDNTLAQIEWAMQKDKQLRLERCQQDVVINFEADAIEHYYSGEHVLAIEDTANWLLDQPFSKRPVLFGANLACTIMKDQESAIAFLKAGLISHPDDPQLLNNIAYSYALSNRPNMALEQLSMIRSEHNLDTVTGICIKATRGLARFRKGEVEEGRRLYLEAIEDTKSANKQLLNWIAILNYAREEILVQSKHVDSILQVVEQIPELEENLEVQALKKDVLGLIKH